MRTCLGCETELDPERISDRCRECEETAELANLCERYSFVIASTESAITLHRLASDIEVSSNLAPDRKTMLLAQINNRFAALNAEHATSNGRW